MDHKTFSLQIAKWVLECQEMTSGQEGAGAAFYNQMEQCRNLVNDNLDLFPEEFKAIPPFELIAPL